MCVCTRNKLLLKHHITKYMIVMQFIKGTLSSVKMYVNKQSCIYMYMYMRMEPVSYQMRTLSSLQVSPTVPVALIPPSP